jgi:predicted XRE-type DNA-binding protein
MGADVADPASRRLAGFPDAEERQTKLRLAYTLNTILDEQRLTQAAAAARLGLNQPKVSALRNDKLEGFSVERLMTLLNAKSSSSQNRVRARRRGSAWWRGEGREEEGGGGGIST